MTHTPLGPSNPLGPHGLFGLQPPSVRALVFRQTGVRGRARGRARGFSYPELLVSVGVMLVIVSLLFPAMNRTRTTYKTIKCASNLQQIGEAALAWRLKIDPQKVEPSVWRTELAKYAERSNKSIFYCPEQDSEAPGVLSTILYPDGVRYLPGVPPGKKIITEPGNPPPGPLMLYVRGSKGGTPDPTVGMAIELRPGAFVKMDNATPDGYRLKIEDSFGRADMDFNDIVLRFRNNPDGTQSLTIESVDRGNSVLTFDLMDANGRVLVPDFATPNSPTGQGFTYGPFKPPTDKVITTPSAPGITTVTKTSKPGDGDSDYAINIRATKIWGNSDKVLFLDYRKTIVADDTNDAPMWTLTGTNRPPFARHHKQINVLYGDGSVRLTGPELLDMNKWRRILQAWEPPGAILQ